MKELKDYLHLYLGCEVLLPNGVVNKVVAKVQSASINYEISLSTAIEIKAKPILRPLSDMTEEEMNDVLSHISDYGDIPSEDFANIQSYLWHLAEALDMADMFELTRKLLSKYFDLFGLHEAGLCLYKTDLK